MLILLILLCMLDIPFRASMSFYKATSYNANMSRSFLIQSKDSMLVEIYLKSMGFGRDSYRCPMQRQILVAVVDIANQLHHR